MELKDYKGIGKTRLAQLNDAGIFSSYDLINYFPKKYYDFSNVGIFAEDNLNKILLVKIVAEPKVVHFKGMNYAICKVLDSEGDLFNAIWYNQPYIKSVLSLNREYYIYGKNSPKKKNTFVVSMTKDKEKTTKKMLPIYKKIGSFGGQTITNLIDIALGDCDYKSLINEDLEAKFNLISLKNAFFEIHNPESEDQIVLAKKRIDTEKLVPLAIKNLTQKIYCNGKRNCKYGDVEKLFVEFQKLIPFSLTGDQLKVISDIKKDLTGSGIMNRLLQGEVGSGKTMVAFFCLWVAANSGYQSTIIAPTEILAKQHYLNLIKTFSGTGVKIAYLSGNMSAAERREALRQVKLGISQIIVGTHAVISSDVEFKNLRLAVIDEQHRFGVVQRAKLAAKAKGELDTLVMSATPIPRSMALALYGNLNLSVITSCPFAKDITTNIVPKQKQVEMWKYISDKIQYGSRVFVVCSNIDSEEDDESYSATNVFKKLKGLFGEQNVALLHGKIKKQESEKIMQSFAAGEISVLVSTTVVEVGVDVPEADIIVIMSPEKFGLATLHQLRGRIGRNGAKSYCFCLANELSLAAGERLKFFRDHSSGFDIAEFDYNNRGAGDVYGTAQHGFSTNFAVNLSNYDTALEIANILIKDEKIKEEALEIAEKTYSKLCNDIVLN
ncbi:MAG: ATP-dependent DNA helicase RecG [Clostridia bacterium]|nr:ATP-dependent DNA helicase RecG [Clostridia bacterium]